MALYPYTLTSGYNCGFLPCWDNSACSVNFISWLIFIAWLVFLKGVILPWANKQLAILVCSSGGKGVFGCWLGMYVFCWWVFVGFLILFQLSISPCIWNHKQRNEGWQWYNRPLCLGFIRYYCLLFPFIVACMLLQGVVLSLFSLFFRPLIITWYLCQHLLVLDELQAIHSAVLHTFQAHLKLTGIHSFVTLQLSSCILLSFGWSWGRLICSMNCTLLFVMGWSLQHSRWSKYGSTTVTH